MSNTPLSEAHPGGTDKSRHGERPAHRAGRAPVPPAPPWLAPDEKTGCIHIRGRIRSDFGMVEQQGNRDVFDSGGMSATRNISLGFFISRGANFA